MSEFGFAYLINSYKEFFNTFLVEKNGLPKEIGVTSNEVASALYFYNDFDEDEMDILLNLIEVKPGKDLRATVWESLYSFIFKVRLVERLQDSYAHLFYTDLVVKENNYDDFNIVDYPKLQDNIVKANMIKKYGKKYEDYEEVLDSIMENGDKISSSYYHLLWDLGLSDFLYDTKYENFFKGKIRLNKVYKDHMIGLENYNYLGDNLLTESEGKSVTELTEDVILRLEELDKEKKASKKKKLSKENK